MEPSTSQPAVPEIPRMDTGETFFKTPNAPPGYHFEQLTVPGLMSGPLIPESVSKLARKLLRRKQSTTTH